MVKIAGKGALGGGGDKDDTELASFAAYGEFFLLEIDMLTVERGKLGDAEAGRKEELEYGSITEIAQSRALGGKDDPLDFIRIEKIDLAGRRVPHLYFFGREGLDVLFGEEFEEGTQDDSVVALSILLEGGSIPSGASIEGDAIVPYGIERDVLRFLDSGGADELVEAAAVALKCAE